MAENTRASRLAIRKETTENTLIALSAGTQFIPLQPDFEFIPNVETIENEEIRSSIGRAAPIQGIEQPSASFSEYLKGSGTQGTAPNWGDLLEACFGSVASNGTERTLDAGSTASSVVLTGGGSDFSRGSAFLLKDGTNGYQIRAVDAVSTNTLTPAFNLTASPAAGVTTGKNVKYTPADSGHPTLSLWMFRGNGGALEAISGARVTELTMEMEVGQLINISFGLEGAGYYYNPLTVDSSNNKLNFTDDDGTFTATIPSKTYKNPHDLADAIKAAMDTANSGQVHTVVYSNSTGKFTISCDGTVLSLLWKTGTNGSDNTDTHIGTLIGFSDAADDSGTAAATGYTSDNAITLTSALTPTYDSTDPLVAKNMEMMVGGSASSYQSICAQSFQLRLANEKQNIRCINAESGVSGSILRERQVEIQVVAVMSRYDADLFDKFINNEDVKMQFSFGVKSGGNWVAGKCGCVYVPTAKIAAFQLGDDNGIVTMQYTIRPYVNSSGQPEIYLNFL